MKLLLDVLCLERLIGGDTKTEIEIRNGIVQEFTKRYLKSIVNEPSFKNFVTDGLNKIKLDCERIQEEELFNVKKDTWGKTTITLKPEFRTKLEAEISRKVSSEVSQIMEESINYHVKNLKDKIDYMESRIGAEIDKRLTEMTEGAINRKIQIHLSKIMNSIKI